MTETTQLPAVEHRAQPYVAISARVASEAEFRQAADAVHDGALDWRLTMYPTAHWFGTSGGGIATSEA